MTEEKSKELTYWKYILSLGISLVAMGVITIKLAGFPCSTPSLSYTCILSSTENVQLDKYYQGTTSNGTNSKNSLTFFPMGRLGNQMFEYASLLGITKRNARTAVLTKTSRDQFTKCFTRITNELSNDPAAFHPDNTFQPPDLHFADSAFFIGPHYRTLRSQMQSWKYFGHVDDVIRSHFLFDRKSQDYAQEILIEMGKTNNFKVTTTFIGIQLRRTDFASTYQNLINPVSSCYIDQAMVLFEDHFEDIVFIIVSDDIEWSKKNIDLRNRKHYISENHTPCVDLALLANCNHSIISSGSSFGWWGAYLAQGHVTYYPKWLKHGGWYNLPFLPSDYFLPQWTVIPR